MRVKLKGLNKRGKNRVREHGPDFIQKCDPCTNAFGDNMVLFESTQNTFRAWKDGPMVQWLGWLQLGKEVEIIG